MTAGSKDALQLSVNGMMRENTGKIVLGFFTFLLISGMLFVEYHFEIKNKELNLYFMAGREMIQAWRKDKVYYLFLPSHISLEEVTLASFSPEFYVLNKGETIEKKESLKGLCREETLLCQTVEKKEHFSLQIRQSENLASVFVETKEKDLARIKADKEYKSRGSMVVIDEKGELIKEVGLKCIRGRGNTSFAGYEKKPYSLELKEEAGILGLPAGVNYALISNASDPSLIRNDMGRWMEQEMNLKYSHRGRFVDLYIDGCYEGNYYLCDDIEIGEERINIRNMEAAMDLVYKYNNYQSEEIYETKNAKARNMSVALEDISGGYLLEREYRDRYLHEYEQINSGFITHGKEHFVVKNPSYCSVEQIEYIRGFLNEAEAAIMDPLGKNHKTGKKYTDYIDIDSFVKRYLAEEVTKNYDGGVSSSYFYKDSLENQGKLCAGPGWDYDMSLGNYVEWMEDFSKNPEGISKLTHHTFFSPWYTKLYDKKEFYALIVENYMAYVGPFLEMLLDRGLREYKEMLEASAAMNEIRWEQELMKNPYYHSREETFRVLEQFLEARKTYLDGVWKPQVE